MAMKTFAEFWPYYLAEHRRPGTRVMHFIGSSVALLLLIGAIILRQPWWVLAAAVSGYAFAWVSHFSIEKNKPATFKYPFWSLAADWKMWGYMITGRLGGELRRLNVQ